MRELEVIFCSRAPLSSWKIYASVLEALTPARHSPFCCIREVGIKNSEEEVEYFNHGL